MQPNARFGLNAIPLRLIPLIALTLILLSGWFSPASSRHGAPIEDFVGDYVGEAMMVTADGETQRRDLSVRIRETEDGFSVKWTTITYKAEGRTKQKTYEIEFLPTDRHWIYSAAMRRNVFGHEVPLDPMKGEPFVWARIMGKTLTVYSLFIDDMGGYELQQYDRTLADGGLQLEFKRFRNGEMMRSVTAFLERQ
ncbi:hypothetical protein [Jhaorihella thermophila]|uniref:DUF3833 family protein n=1 Tax=Jhaorihella thermophila TaxID=488547 RepID=A0A1H5Y3E0_9RHOB|nr:hypothetical protein [Jhaorihella thermophila]SEG18352.1 hypothetical protein SAMN05421751_11437 [Jhaorihella thermophila]